MFWFRPEELAGDGGKDGTNHTLELLPEGEGSSSSDKENVLLPPSEDSNSSEGSPRSVDRKRENDAPFDPHNPRHIRDVDELITAIDQDTPKLAKEIRAVVNL